VTQKPSSQSCCGQQSDVVWQAAFAVPQHFAMLPGPESAKHLIFPPVLL
jgi:hypothetical protein